MIDNTPLQGAFPRIAGAAAPEELDAMTPMVPPVEVSRLLLLLFVAAGAVVSVATSPPLSSFAGGFATGAGAVIVLSFLKNPRRSPAPDGDGGSS
jgi:hypothetical protein